MANDKKKKKNANQEVEKEKSSIKRAMNASKAAEAQKRRQSAAAKSNGQQTEKKGGWGDYFRGVKIETKKVVWPTRQELISYTVVVLFTCAFFGLMIWGVDTAFIAALRELITVPF